MSDRPKFSPEDSRKRIQAFAKRRTAKNRGVTEKTHPSRFLSDEPTQCYACSMKSVHRCEFPGCGLPLCGKHTIHKAGGKLCYDHRGAQLVQDNSIPGPENSADSVPAARFVKSNSYVTKPHESGDQDNAESESRKPQETS